MEDCFGLPSLPDLLNELDNDVDIESLEKLTQSLLQDIAADLEAASQKTNNEESVALQEYKVNKRVVGSTSENVESSGCESVVVSDKKLEDEIAPFLLLHHNYSAKPDTEPLKKIQNQKLKESYSRRLYQRKKDKKEIDKKSKFKVIQPKIVSDSQKSLDSKLKEPEEVYGSLEGNSDSIMIVMENKKLNEAVSELVSSDTEISSNEDLNSVSDAFELTNRMSLLEVPDNNKSKYVHSPSSNLSDYGYESSASPQSFEENDFSSWDNSVSELFPTLM
ncbi:uncharacterized protein LOC108745220 isoform X1 [Agrilus planipennis]|uniref:Uncharacterized protein LOC108745220 isoform X1 n=1 Tax=Agrilus planipennis TaxID=224129 RepID=A0A1W4XWK8_AGRPL|nr:uncharacterized protein LOC108745220 isoform X1 [Agrilus planipennis]